MDIKLPELGEGIASGDVVTVLVKEGDEISKGQGLIEIETDKASVEIPSEHAGKVSKIHVKPGETLKVGGIIVTLEGASGEAPAKEAPKAAPAKAAPAKAAPAEAKEAPKEEKKAAPAKPAPKPQPEPAAEEEDEEDIEEESEEPAPLPKKHSSVAPVISMEAASNGGGIVPAGPAMRRFAREVGVDLANVQGTGENGRITRADILRVVREGTQSATALKAPSPIPAPKTAGAKAPERSPVGKGELSRDNWGAVRIEKLPKIRQTIAKKMVESWETIPRVTNFDDADVTELEQIRQSSKDDYLSAGIKLTSLPFVVKACAMALRANPVVNASVDMEAGTAIYKDYVNIGIAVDTDRGLVVPSLRSADRLSIPEIARGLATLADKAKSASFAIDDLRGSTFTISNLGAIGGTYSTPIINPPEVAILLIGRARKMPVVIDHKFAVRLLMPLSLSYDHRLVDGAAAARFLNDIKSFLQSPSRLLLAP